jgi:heptosyltransferase-2
VKKILVVNVNWLGDAILTTPVFKALKDKFPLSYIAVMVIERVKEVFEDNPYIDEIIIFNEKKGGLLSKIKFITELRGKRFDMAFLIHRSFTRALICFLAGIKERIGYRRLKNAFILTKKIKPSGVFHRQDYYLYIFERLEIGIKDRIPQFFIPYKIQKKIKSLLEGIKCQYSYIVGINPSANWELKRWPAYNFSFLADRLIEELNCGVIFIGAGKDRGVVNEVLKCMKNKPYNFCGQTTLKELGGLIGQMDLFISNDSGPAHLASALGIVTLVLFGPTSPEVTSPRGRNVRIIRNISCKVPCYDLNCEDNICMKGISVDDVFLEVKKILK